MGYIKNETEVNTPKGLYINSSVITKKENSL